MSRILPTPLMFISGYANTENVFYCLIVVDLGVKNTLKTDEKQGS